MPASKIFITQTDAEKLRTLMREMPFEERNSPYIRALEAELERATITDSKAVPADVVTMNSQAVLKDLETGEEMTYTLVFPEEADAMNGKISVLAPVGTAMLGYRAGETFEWDTPDGVVKIRVEKVIYQPEAAGDER